MQNNKLDSGRSMVEMLGTLAIIGVLSIGGIAGYSYGMDKYRANTIMNDVNLRAIDLIAQTSMGNALSLATWPKKSTTGYQIGLEVKSNITTGGIQVSDVEKDVCKIIVNDLLPIGVSLVINKDNTEIKICEEENTLIFYYDDIMEDQTKGTSTCSDQEDEVNGNCYSTSSGKENELNHNCSVDDDCQIGYTGTNCGQCLEGKCVSNTERNGDPCTLNSGITGQCSAGKCQPTDGCSDSKPCPDGYFCAVPTSQNSCSSFYNKTGVCTKPNKIYNRFFYMGYSVYLTKRPVELWDAYSACEELGGNFDIQSTRYYRQLAATLLPETYVPLFTYQNTAIIPNYNQENQGNKQCIITVTMTKQLTSSYEDQIVDSAFRGYAFCVGEKIPCVDGEFRCNIGMPISCANNEWKRDINALPSGKKCDGENLVDDIPIQDDCQENETRCYNGVYQICNNSIWTDNSIPDYESCNGNDLICDEGVVRCYNSTYQICQSNEWNDISGWLPSGKICDGNNLVDE